MGREDRDRDEIRRRVESSSGGEVVAGLEAEEEASAEASQRPGPRGRIGGVPREEPGEAGPSAREAGPSATEAGPSAPEAGPRAPEVDKAGPG
jgi:hypothetical protein